MSHNLLKILGAADAPSVAGGTGANFVISGGSTLPASLRAVVGGVGSAKPRHRAKEPVRKTLRRLRGFLIAFEGREARVGFVGKAGEITEYFLPAHYLKENNITEPAQPFEFDEFEERTKGKLSTGKEFRPMALPSAGYKKSVELSAEESELQKAIFSFFRKVESEA